MNRQAVGQVSSFFPSKQDDKAEDQEYLRLAQGSTVYMYM